MESKRLECSVRKTDVVTMEDFLSCEKSLRGVYLAVVVKDRFVGSVVLAESQVREVMTWLQGWLDEKGDQEDTHPQEDDATPDDGLYFRQEALEQAVRFFGSASYAGPSNPGASPLPLAGDVLAVASNFEAYLRGKS